MKKLSEKVAISKDAGGKYDFQSLFWKLYGERLRKSNKAHKVYNKLTQSFNNYGKQPE